MTTGSGATGAKPKLVTLTTCTSGTSRSRPAVTPHHQDLDLNPLQAITTATDALTTTTMSATVTVTATGAGHQMRAGTAPTPNADASEMQTDFRPQFILLLNSIPPYFSLLTQFLHKNVCL